MGATTRLMGSLQALAKPQGSPQPHGRSGSICDDPAFRRLWPLSPKAAIV